MSRKNKHQCNHADSISLAYIRDELGLKKKCPRKSCTGTLTIVWTRYSDHGPINMEEECSTCGKSIKDKKFSRRKDKIC